MDFCLRLAYIGFMNILLVEDDELIASGIVAGLQAQAMQVHHAANGQQAEVLQLEHVFDATVLDLGLPDTDGLQLLAHLRAVQTDLPVLILTARDAIEHRLQGLNCGADDYMIKPFDLRELAARLHALVRRTQGRSQQLIQAGPLRLEPSNGLVWLHDEPVVLSRREIQLLTHLASTNGRWVRTEDLQERLYGLSAAASGSALKVHVHNIRGKLGNQAIETARGLGYRLGWKLS